MIKLPKKSLFRDVKYDWFQTDYITDLSWREEIYTARNQRIKEVCSNYKKIYKNPVQGKFFLFDLRHRLAVCYHPKVGITSQAKRLQ